MEFKELGIIPSILSVLFEQNYITPTPIQSQTIPEGLKGRDILGLAQTGTGKTASFAIPTLQHLSKNKRLGHNNQIRALVLTPTRELAIQVHDSFETYGRNVPQKSAVIFGGVRQGKQVNELKRGVDILVATPGRLLDLIQQGYVDISKIEIFVLDEADRMLDMGFINDIRKIIKLIPIKKQTMLFSATMPKEMESITKSLLVDPAIVTVTPVSSTVDTIRQSLFYVDQKNKINMLADFITESKTGSILVFARTKHGSDKIVKELAKKNIVAKAIHGNKSQGARQSALDKFKKKEIRALVATDIASRGIDIDQLEYVINFDLPETPETYVHRIGRTGRAGKEGVAISFCSFQEKHLLKAIEKLIKKEIEVIENPKYPMIDETIKEKGRKQRPRRQESHNNSQQKPETSQSKKLNHKSQNNKNNPANVSRQSNRPKHKDISNTSKNRNFGRGVKKK